MSRISSLTVGGLIAPTLALLMLASVLNAAVPAGGGGRPFRAVPSTGLVPLCEMGEDQTYRGEDGGLYGRGQNEPPPALAAAARQKLAEIHPLDAEGKPSADGKIVLMSIGMSNTRMEFAALKDLAGTDPLARTWYLSAEELTQEGLKKSSDASSSRDRQADPPGAATFVPYFYDDFEAYDDGASLTAGKPFGAAGRTKASSEKAHGGRRSARMAIQQGDRGGFGRWGGIVAIKPPLPRGSEIWVRLYVYWPGDFEFSARPWMKFIRLHNRTADGKNGGYNDLYVDHADGDRAVLRTIKEGQDVWRTYDGPPLGRDRWESYEVYLFVDDRPVDDGGKGRFRVWRDGKSIFDRTDVPTISTADGVIDSLFLFTYWNNEQPPTNHLFVDDLAIATSASPPPGRDAAGNVFIGDWTPRQKPARSE